MRQKACAPAKLRRALDHAQVALRQVVVEGHPEVVHEGEHGGAVLLQPVEQVLGRRLLGSPALTGGTGSSRERVSGPGTQGTDQQCRPAQGEKAEQDRGGRVAAQRRTRTLRDGTRETYWHGEVYVGRGQDGKKRVLRHSAKSRGEVLAWLTQTNANRLRGMLAEPTRETVGQFLDRWLRDSATPSVKSRTLDSYTTMVNRHLIPELGEVLLRKLTPGHVQALYSKRLAEGLSARTVHRIHAVLHRALGQAVRWGIVPRNVTDAVDRPKVARTEMKTLTPDEARRFLEASREDRFHALYVLAISTGMRQSELLGLTWTDVDLEESRIQVRRQLQRNRQRKEYELTETKTGRARNISLTRQATDALRAHRKRQAEERLALGEAWQDERDLVFTTAVGTPVGHSTLLRWSFHPLRAHAGVPRIRFHDLRHTCATLLLTAGEHPKVVQEILGHASVTLTLDTYSHVLPSMREAAASRMEVLLDGTKKAKRPGG